VQAGPHLGTSDARLMVRIAQMYYRMDLSQEQIGTRLGLSRFRVGRLLERALREDIVRIEVVHPDAHAVVLEERLVQRFGLEAAVVADVPAASGAGREADDLARDAVADAAADYLRARRPTGAIAVSWGRTMLALARRLPDGWTQATEIVQLNGAASRSTHPTRANEILERFAATSGATFRGMAAPAIVGGAELRDALMEDPAIRETVDAARSAPSAVFGLGIPAPDSPHLASGFVDEDEQARLRKKGAVGDVIGRFLDADGEIAWRKLDRRTVGLPLDELARKPFRMGVAAGAGRGPIALAAIRGGYVNVLATDDATAAWVLAHG
jgi:deoxyribonucleoside regulator